MPEPAYYQTLRELGALFHTQDFILKLGRVKFGEPSDKQVAKLKAIQDLEHLDRIAVKVLTVKTWDALLRVK